eukprot:Awhi_evm1s6911
MYVDFESGAIEYTFVVHLDRSIDSIALSAHNTRYPSASFKSGTMPINYIEFTISAPSNFPEEIEYLLSHPNVMSLEKYEDESFFSTYMDGLLATDSPIDALQKIAQH